jgi:hypothetical protein
MHEDYLPPTRKNNVRATRQTFIVKPVPVARSMSEASHNEFGAGILSSDAAHASAALVGSESIGHNGIVITSQPIATG